MSLVPAATRTLRVLRFMATQPGPVPVDRIARACDLPRSTTYQLLGAMADEGFVVHLADERRFGLGIAAFEIGSGYLRQEPLQRVARRPLAELVDRVGESGHVAVLRGRDVLYVLEDRAPNRPSLVSDVGVELPAHLTACGRAILAGLPAAQVRALYFRKDQFIDRTGTGPRSLSALRPILRDARSHGYAEETGEITEGLNSVAAAVVDHLGHPVAAVALTFPATAADRTREFSRRVAATAETISRRLGGA